MVRFDGDDAHDRFGNTIDADGDESPGGVFEADADVLYDGDFSRDGQVGFSDFNTLLANWNQAGGWDDGDSSHDGQVGFADFNALLGNWNKSIKSGGAERMSASVDAPEPQPAEPAPLRGNRALDAVLRRLAPEFSVGPADAVEVEEGGLDALRFAARAEVGSGLAGLTAKPDAPQDAGAFDSADYWPGELAMLRATLPVSGRLDAAGAATAQSDAQTEPVGDAAADADYARDHGAVLDVLRSPALESLKLEL
jgi:hypothetical protein